MRALVIVIACGCGRLPVMATAAAANGSAVRLEPKSFAVPDETMEFRATLRGMTVGVVQTAVGRPGWIDGRHAIKVRSRGHGDGLVSILGDLTWELTSTIDLERGYPIEDREEAWLELAGTKAHEDEHHTWNADDVRHDVHSVVCALRGWQSEPGQHTEVQVEVGGGHFPIEVWSAGREYLASANKPALRYDGVAHREFHFAFWLSDDTARVPLLFRTESKLGAIAIELVDYQVPRD